LTWIRRANSFIAAKMKQWGLKRIEHLFLEEHWRSASAALRSKPFAVGFNPWLESIEYRSNRW